MRAKRKNQTVRDDAEAQPESGYPDGRLPTKPSAHPEALGERDSLELRPGSGSEADFGSVKRRDV